MKKEIIYIDDYALIVNDDVIKKGDLLNYSYQYIEPIGHVILKHNEPILENGFLGKKIIGHRPLKDAPILEGVPLLPEFSKEDDVKKLALKTYPFSNSERNAFITGYNKAKETYKYTEEDLRKAMRMYKGEFTKGIVYSQDSIIQSLNQSEPKLPVAIECEMKKDYLYNDDGDKYGFPVHPTNEVKTTTNSQGRTELVGEYIY
jgi:hypothetical protein